MLGAAGSEPSAAHNTPKALQIPANNDVTRVECVAFSQLLAHGVVQGLAASATLAKGGSTAWGAAGCEPPVAPAGTLFSRFAMLNWC
jgi:hypothetical protein